jgi:trehalose 6-phosphate phosphatase
LFLDVDGTLLDIAATPDAVHVSDELRATLGGLSGALEGALALVSGRPIASIDRLFAPLILPAAGQHGAEIRNDGGLQQGPPNPNLPAITAALKHFVATRPGLVVEEKGESVALHYRLAPHYREAARTLVTSLMEACGGGLEVLPARMAFDIKPKAVDKGAAIEWFLTCAAFRDRVPVFVGDDRTDEDGFSYVNTRGGHSIRVGLEGDSGAAYRMPAPAAVRQWLTLGLEALALEGAARQ